MLAAGPAMAQGIGAGIGLDDVKPLAATVNVVVACGTLQFDHTAPCNAALVPLTGP
jgi:hypothetical protein